jgi:hypothetical protein
MKLRTVSVAILMNLALQTANAHAQTGGKWAPLALPESVR